jgi:hypothetical protein
MSTITQAVDGLLARLLLPATRLLWIHGLFEGSGSRLSFAGRLRGRWIEESNQMRRIKASWGRADFEVCGQREVLEGGTLYGDRVATKLPIIAKTMRAVSRSGVRRRDRAAEQSVIVQ